MWRISGSFVVSAVSRRWWWLRARGCPVPLRTGPGVLPQGSWVASFRLWTPVMVRSVASWWRGEAMIWLVVWQRGEAEELELLEFRQQLITVADYGIGFTPARLQRLSLFPRIPSRRGSSSWSFAGFACLNLPVVVAFVGSVSCSVDSLFPQPAAVARCWRLPRFVCSAAAFSLEQSARVSKALRGLSLAEPIMGWYWANFFLFS